MRTADQQLSRRLFFEQDNCLSHQPQSDFRKNVCVCVSKLRN